MVRHLSRYDHALPLHEIAAHCYAHLLTPWLVVTDRPVAIVLMAKDADGHGCIWYAGGEQVEKWEAEVIALALMWSTDNCDGSLYVEGRKGWQRRLSRYGFVRRGEKLWAASPASRPQL